MDGELNDAMAEAVENAAVVIICMSKYYQESANCQKGGSVIGDRIPWRGGRLLHPSI